MAPVIRATPAQIAAARAALPAYDAWLAPGQPSRILFEVRMLLDSFPERAMVPAHREALMERWTRDLDDLPLHAIAAACSELRRSKTEYSPLLAEIRVAALDTVREASDERFRLRRLVEVGRKVVQPEESPQEKELMSARLLAAVILMKSKRPYAVADVDELGQRLMEARREARKRLDGRGAPFDDHDIDRLARALAMPEEEAS